jgi:hypothetical protein
VNQVRLGVVSSNSLSPCVSLTYSQACELVGLNSNKHSPTSPSRGIHILNVDVLLSIFDIYRLANPDEYYDGRLVIMAWARQRWWYKLVHVCRQWRNIILQSPSLLNLHLFCTHGVPVAYMLAHSPPLPLIIFYNCTDQSPDLTAQDESDILLALSHRDRVRRILLWVHHPNLGKFITVMEGRFPVLERMGINSQTEVVLPVTFQAPNLRHLGLTLASLPIPSPLLTTTTRLAYLNLNEIPPSAYFPPSYLLARLSLTLQLEVLTIRFFSPLPNRDVEKQLLHAPSITQLTLPKLRRFMFRGAATYLDGLVDRISAPSLHSLSICLYGETSFTGFTVPRLAHFLQSSENLRFGSVKVAFDANSVSLDAGTPRFPRLELQILCGYLDRQVASAVDIFGALSPVLSVAEKVTLTDASINRSLALRDDVERRQWRELLRPFTNVKTIHVQRNLVGKIFNSLLPAEGESPVEPLPNLEEVRYSGGLDSRDAVSAFVDARRAAGHLVSLRMVTISQFPDDSDSDTN